jgi:predicted GNAT family N-acyltransferase
VVTGAPVRVVAATTEADLAVARGLEHDVFAAEGFVPASDRRVIEEYTDLDAQSRWYLARRGGETAGVLRVIEPGPVPVPAVGSFAIDAAAQDLLARHRYVEIGTLALSAAERGSDVGLHLYRAALRDSMQDGVTVWVAVLEQWLLQRFAAAGFPFEQMGAGRYYMGGDCLPVVLDLERGLAGLHANQPALHRWLTVGTAAAADARVPRPRPAPAGRARPIGGRVGA